MSGDSSASEGAGGAPTLSRPALETALAGRGLVAEPELVDALLQWWPALARQVSQVRTALPDEVAP